MFWNEFRIHKTSKFGLFINENQANQILIYDRQVRSYRTRAIIGRSRFEAALVYKPRILGL